MIGFRGSFRGGTVARIALAAMLVASPSVAQEVRLKPDSHKSARALRVTDGAIRVDGRLDEAAWQGAPAIVDFVQKEPVEGVAPSDPIDVRIVYDGDAIYIGARLGSRAPIVASLGRRDEPNQAEHLLVSLDTYLDRRTASTFGITAAGVRLDHYYASDDEDSADGGFNPVWAGEIGRDARGWTAELRIPFSQLRFNDREPRVWGLNIERRIPARNEHVFWSLVPRTESRWASLFGDLHGLDGITPRRRIELLPYVAGSSQVIGDRDKRNPFASAANLDGRVGLDAKVGLGSNLTLEATVNPDFGQVEADPAEVNLSAVETFFTERRPFFLEGANLLSGFVNNYFYSRRVGAAPPGRVSGDYVDVPRASTILGAAKLTGRLQSGTSVGVLSGVTGEETARTFTPGLPIGTTRVAAPTVFGVARVEQEFGPPGSTVGLMSTLLHRQLSPGEPLASMLTSSAVSLSGDVILRFKDGEYEARAFLGGTRVAGSAPAIDRIQRSSAHYLQRPDAPYFAYDPARTSLSGIKTGAHLERRTGRHWNWGVDSQLETSGFEANDIGRLSSADGLQNTAWLSYRETTPRGWYRNYQVQVAHDRRFTYDWIRREGLYEVSGGVEWANYWETSINFQRRPRAQNERLTRGGPLMQTPRGWTLALAVDSNRAKRLQADSFAQYGRDEDGGLNFEVSQQWEYQPGSRWGVAVEPRYQRQVDVRQYIATLASGSAATFGSRYIFGRVDRSTWSTQIRANYTFKPDVTLDLYTEPFAASGQYDAVGELLAARGRALGYRSLQSFGLGARDFNVQSFRSNLVLRWEYRPGSTLYLVWQQDRAGDAFAPRRATSGDMFDSFAAAGDNFFVVKASVWVSR